MLATRTKKKIGTETHTQTSQLNGSTERANGRRKMKRISIQWSLNIQRIIVSA